MRTKRAALVAIALVVTVLLPTSGATAACQPRTPIKPGATPGPVPHDPAPNKTDEKGKHALFWEVHSSARVVDVKVVAVRNLVTDTGRLFGRRPPQEGFINYEDGDSVDLTVTVTIVKSKDDFVACRIRQDEREVTYDARTAENDNATSVVCFWSID